MKELYKKMQERLNYLETLPLTEEVKGRRDEITLAIIAVQELLLRDITHKQEHGKTTQEPQV